MPTLFFFFNDAPAKRINFGTRSRLDDSKQALHQCRVHYVGNVNAFLVNGNLCVGANDIWRSSVCSRFFQKPTVRQPFLEAFDPFAGGFGVVRAQAKAVAAPGVDVQFGGHFELFEFQIHAGQSFRDVGPIVAQDGLRVDLAVGLVEHKCPRLTEAFVT